MALKCSLSYIVPMETENDGVVARVTEGGAAAGTGVAEAKSVIQSILRMRPLVLSNLCLMQPF
ncbi:hypothetical protein DPMN_121807 [Dreissena polymorpha]|uniref:Uncharacterized protein n=1 Tax=Dreissena polymorpha TaxID=45954 RepID=A0A9D4GQR6_DREPO|nr:hypothetical protein DPMN_121807 [Dreissena polymorpha]